jgi:hypothetical protein
MLNWPPIRLPKREGRMRERELAAERNYWWRRARQLEAERDRAWAVLEEIAQEDGFGLAGTLAARELVGDEPETWHAPQVWGRDGHG